jgi:hypothetical protein
VDRRAGLSVAGPPAWAARLLLVVLVAACARPRPDAPRVLARGSLAYAAGWADDGTLWTVELTERFELVARGGPDLRERGRIDVGAATVDVLALASAGDHVYLGRADGWIEDRASADGAVRARWPQGAAVTALAVIGPYLVVADASDAVCVRRRADGALLQCRAELRRGPGAVVLGRYDRATVELRHARDRRALRVPALTDAPTGSGDPASRLHARAVTLARPGGGSRTYHFAGKATAVVVGRRGVVATGWIRRLDDPSVVWWPR